MSPAAARIRSDVAWPMPIRTKPARSTGTDDVCVASAVSAQPAAAATKPAARTGRRPYLSIVRPATTAVSPEDVRKIAGPSPSRPRSPVTSTNVIDETADASCSTTEFTAVTVARTSVFRRIVRSRSGTHIASQIPRRRL